MSRRTPIDANRLLALLSKVLGFARGKAAPNPCRDVERNPENQRSRTLRGDEFPNFVAAIDQYEAEAGNATHADVLRVLLWTGQRSGNVFAMRWRDLDLDGGTWTIPGEVFKNKLPHVAALPPNIVALLRRRKTRTLGEYVFPGKGSPHVRDVRNAWYKVLDLAGIDPDTIHMHDVRAHFATAMAREQVNIQAIAGQLGHKSIQTTQRYVRLAQADVKAAVAKTTAAMDAQAAPRRKETA